MLKIICTSLLKLFFSTSPGQFSERPTAAFVSYCLTLWHFKLKFLPPWQAVVLARPQMMKTGRYVTLSAPKYRHWLQDGVLHRSKNKHACKCLKTGALTSFSVIEMSPQFSMASEFLQVTGVSWIVLAHLQNNCLTPVPSSPYSHWFLSCTNFAAFLGNIMLEATGICLVAFASSNLQNFYSVLLVSSVKN